MNGKDGIVYIYVPAISIYKGTLNDMDRENRPHSDEFEFLFVE